MEENKMNEKIIVSSDENIIGEWAVVYGVCVLPLVGLIIYFIAEWYRNGSTAEVIMIIVLIFCAVAIIASTIEEWFVVGRKIVMNQEGCHISFDSYYYHYQKFYRWDELKAKRYDKGYERLERFGGRVSFFAPCYEGIIFSAAPIEKDNIYFKKDSEKRGNERYQNPYAYCLRHPQTTFFVRFYTYGVSEGNGDHRSQVQARNEYKKRKHIPGEKKPQLTRGPEVYPVEKEKFLACMDIWHVEIEGLTEMDRIMYAEESLKIGEFHF